MSATPVQLATAAYFKISLEVLITGSSRQPLVGTARHCARWLERKSGLSYPAIGRLYNTDHSAVYASVAHMGERLAARDERYVVPVREIELMTVVERANSASEAKALLLESMSCPTCGAPVILELQRQIRFLNEQVAMLKNGKVK